MGGKQALRKETLVFKKNNGIKKKRKNTGIIFLKKAVQVNSPDALTHTQRHVKYIDIDSNVHRTGFKQKIQSKIT